MKKLLLIVGLSALSQVSNAQTFISQTQNFNFIPDGTVPLVFNKYNGLLADVDNIYIVVNLSKEGGSLFIDNDSASGGSGNITQTVRVDLSSGTVTLLDTSFGAIGSNVSAVSSYFATVGANDGDGAGYQFGTTDHDGTEFTTPVSASDDGNVNSIFWNQYVGSGTFTINVAGIQSLNTSAISGVAGTFTPASAVGSVTVIYTVPEPSSAMLVGLASLGLMIRRRRN